MSPGRLVITAKMNKNGNVRVKQEGKESLYVSKKKKWKRFN